jgi:hypothetical protein
VDGPAEWAERVTALAEEVDLDVAAAASLPHPPAGAGRTAGGGPGGLEDALARGGGPGREPLDPETRQVVEEAREMTRRRRGETGGEEGEADSNPDGADGADADHEAAGDAADEKE